MVRIRRHKRQLRVNSSLDSVMPLSRLASAASALTNAKALEEVRNALALDSQKNDTHPSNSAIEYETHNALLWLGGSSSRITVSYPHGCPTACCPRTSGFSGQTEDGAALMQCWCRSVIRNSGQKSARYWHNCAGNPVSPPHTDSLLTETPLRDRFSRGP